MAPRPGPANSSAEASASPAGPLDLQRTRSSSYGLSKQTTAERINQILETGRERAERASISNNLPDHPMPRSPGGTHPWSILGQRRPSSRANGDYDDSSADERTRIVSRGGHVSYQGTATSETSARARNGTGNGFESTESRAEGDDQSEGREHKPARAPWYQTLLEPFQSIELENKGSVARDHLAIERTFLAWLRTSLAFASIGIAVTQLFRLNRSISDDNDPTHHTLRQLGKPLGATFLGISIVMLFLGYRRFTESQKWVMQGKFPASRGIILLVTFLAFALTVASLVVVIVVNPKDREL
ncbi:uncharacterized protein DNG_03614 [Cephalotrichum gorgonifer]|uniref:DUF202 domain-containing protein n=1 Tax=Cephalotrichum gorgonifer TaxID=2041049 RepID=A0AAE8STR8_9PEZI|nr:uncharacterized protein DNG_03614 [Cephalotrichum gorgonifer]